MPTFFASSFSAGRKGPSPESVAIKQAKLIIAKAKAGNSAGMINDPATYDKAIKLLDGYNDNLAVLTEQSNLEAEKNKLLDNINDQWTKKNTYNQALQNGIYQIGKNNISSPETVVMKTASLYDLYAQQLQKEISDRITNGEAYDQLQPELQKAQDQAENFATLSRSSLTGGSNSLVKQQFGFVAKTDPDTGKIISFAVQPVSADTLTGYMKTNTNYGGVPVYVNAVRDPNDDNNYIAKLGNESFKGAVSNSNPSDVTSPSGLNQKVLELQNNDKGPSAFGKLAHKLALDFEHPLTDGADLNKMEQADNNKGLDLRGRLDASMFGDLPSLPKNSVGKDSQGNLYLVNNDGKLFQSNDANTIAQYLGKTPQEVTDNAFFLTAKDVQQLKTQQDPTQQGNSVLTSPQSPMSAAQSRANFVGPLTPDERAQQPTSEAPAAGPQLAGGPSAGPRAIQQPQGNEKAKDNTEQVTKGGLFSKIAAASKAALGGIGIG